MSGQTEEDYALINKVIDEIFEKHRPVNYTFNHGELMDALKKRCRELRKRQIAYEKRASYLSDYYQGQIHGIEECTKILFKLSKEEKPSR
jgi:hypothetical protein